MNNQNMFDDASRDWSEFAWEVMFDGLPTSSDLNSHELRNDFNSQIYLNEDRELWSQDRSKAEIGPDQLEASHIVEAYRDLFGKKENVETSRKIFQQAIDDETIPDKPRKAAEKALKIHEGIRNYSEIVQNKNNPDGVVSYDRVIGPVKDEPYVSLNEENVEELKQEEKKVKVGESVFFFLNTVDKNFREYVIDEVDDPELNVDAYIEDDKLRIDVYDNGPGIDEEEIRGIFEPEFGNGTGLPTANYIIEEYGGELELYEEAEGFGLTATFDLEEV